MSHLLQDVRYGIRTLLRSPGFTLIAALTLALGIGANTAIFSMVENVLLRPLPYPQPDGLVQISNSYLPTVSHIGLSPGDYADWRRQANSLSEMAAYVSISRGFNLTGDAQAQRIQASYASASLFPLLGVHPLIGRSFVSDEDRAGSAPVVMLSHHLWASRFGSDPAIVGRAVVLDAHRYTVVGIVPANFQLLRWADLWMPIGQFDDDLTSHVHHDFDVIARLKPGVTVGQAQAEMAGLNRQEEIAFPDTHHHWGVSVERLEAPEAGRVRTTLLVFFGAVGLVLLIVCANIVNLLLVRNSAREKELAVRIAMGASPWRLVRQLLTESVLLALAGGMLGLLVAFSGSKVLLSLLPPDLTVLRETPLNGWVLAFAIAVCLAAGLICGALPALETLKTDLNDVLKQGSKGATVPGSHRVHNSLVVAEIAMALVPLVGAGLLLRSFQHLIEIDPGFRPDHILTMNVPQAGLTRAQANGLSLAQQLAFAERQSRDFERLAQQIRVLPGVEAIGAIDDLPLGSEFRQASRFVIEGRPIPNTELRPVAQFRTVSLGYFPAMGIPLLKGRLFTPDDWKLENVVVINDAMEHRFWPGGDSLGKRINLCSLDPTPCWSTIIGVVADVHQFGLDRGATFDTYFSGGWTPYLVIRTAADPAVMATAVTGTIHKMDPNLPVTQIMTMDNLLSDSVSPRRFASALIGIFAVFALLLAAVGIYGVMSYVVRQRTHEIGIRLALGAEPKDVRTLVIGRGAKLAAMGVAIGLVGAFALTRLLSSLLFEVKARDPLTFAGVTLLLIAVVLLACYVPARRATRVDPMIALRHE
jgi:putative ABC transport system permease protein